MGLVIIAPGDRKCRLAIAVNATAAAAQLRDAIHHGSAGNRAGGPTRRRSSAGPAACNREASAPLVSRAALLDRSGDRLILIFRLLDDRLPDRKSTRLNPSHSCASRM